MKKINIQTIGEDKHKLDHDQYDPITNPGEKIVLPKGFGTPGNMRFADFLEYHLNMKIQRFINKDLDRQTMENIYAIIVEIVGYTFSKGAKPLSEKAYTWVAQKYFESIKLSHNKFYNDDIETWDSIDSYPYTPIPASDIRLDELRFLGGIYSESTFSDEILKEVRRRALLA